MFFDGQDNSSRIYNTTTQSPCFESPPINRHRGGMMRRTDVHEVTRHLDAFLSADAPFNISLEIEIDLISF